MWPTDSWRHLDRRVNLLSLDMVFTIRVEEAGNLFGERSGVPSVLTLITVKSNLD